MIGKSKAYYREQKSVKDYFMALPKEYRRGKQEIARYVDERRKEVLAELKAILGFDELPYTHESVLEETTLYINDKWLRLKTKYETGVYVPFHYITVNRKGRMVYLDCNTPIEYIRIQIDNGEVYIAKRHLTKGEKALEGKGFELICTYEDNCIAQYMMRNVKAGMEIIYNPIYERAIVVRHYRVKCLSNDNILPIDYRVVINAPPSAFIITKDKAMRIINRKSDNMEEEADT